ncbi:MAG: hypothetical protein HYS22_04825 [Deltaproteobacteria bacterium]|nr:hypothetical protein [Deltaproteobacteria bacterium]
MPFTLFLLFPLSGQSADFHIDSSLLGQVRKNSEGQTEVPINGYLGFAVAQPSWRLSSETNMRLFRDFDQKINDYDLYQAVLHINPTEPLKIDFGRQFVNQGFSVETLDAIRLTLTAIDPLAVTLYSGIPRSVERGDFNKDDGLLTGLSLALRDLGGTRGALHVAWRKNSIQLSDLQNDQVFTGLNISHRFNVKSSPMIYGLFEYDATGKTVNSGTAGVDIYPSHRLALNAEFDYYDINRKYDRRTIFGTFTKGGLISGRFSSTVTLVPGWLDFVETYAYQSVAIQEGIRKNGHLLDTSLEINIDTIGFTFGPGYYFAKSFGGQVHGIRFFGQEQFTEKWTADLGVDYSQYKKVTNDNDYAFSTIAWTGYEVVKGLTVSGGFEFNQNNLFNKDTRGSFKIDYRFN